MIITNNNIILSGVVGSKAYGLDHPGSDTDRMAVFSRDPEDFLTLYPPNDDSKMKAQVGGDDITMHELRKYCHLCLKSNPSAMELLWLDEYDKMDDIGKSLLTIRELFLGQKYVRTSYLGYMNSQIAGVKRDKQASKREKYGRHLYRLAKTGVLLWQTGELVLQVEDREEAFYYGVQGAKGNLGLLEDLLSWTEEEFSKTSPLPKEASTRIVEAWYFETKINQQTKSGRI